MWWLIVCLELLWSLPHRRVTSEESILAKVQKEQQQDEELADLMEYLECKQLQESAIRRVSCSPERLLC